MKTAFLLFFFLLSINANAQFNDVVVNYSQTGSLQLGASVDYRFLDIAKQRIITNDKVESIDGGVSQGTTFQGKLISSITELYNKLNINYDFSGSGSVIPFFSGSAELDSKLDLETDYSDNKLYYLIQATTNFGREGYSNPQIPDSLKNMMVNNPTKFIRNYGTHLVQYQTRSSSIYLLYEITTSNKYSKESIYSKFTTKFDFSVADIATFSGSSNLEFNKFNQEVKKLATVNIKFFSTSDSGLATVANLIDTSKSLTGIVTDLKKILTDPQYSKGAVSQYVLTSYQRYGLSIPPLDVNQQFYYEKFANIKAQLINEKERIQQYLQNLGSFQFKNYYLQKNLELTNYINQLGQLESNCISGVKCDTPSLTKLSNIPFQWLENIIDVDKIRLIPSYEDVYDNSGKKVGEIINGIRIVCSGVINNAEYFRVLNSAYLDVNFNILQCQNDVTDGHNLDLGQPSSTNTYFSSQRFTYLVDVAKPSDYERNIEGRIVNSNNNGSIANNFIKDLKSRSYFLQVTSKDNLQFFTDLGVLALNDVLTTK